MSGQDSAGMRGEWCRAWMLVKFGCFFLSFGAAFMEVFGVVIGFAFRGEKTALMQLTLKVKGIHSTDA